MITTLVVDGNNLLMRSIKAAENRMHLSVEHDGEEVNTAPLLLFINMLSRYVRQVRPDRMVVCWDGGRSAHRVSIYPEYKSARHDRGEEKDDTPFAMAKRFLSLSGIHHVEMPDVEADDLVAAYVRDRPDGTQTVILSGDKDFLQLLGPSVCQIRPGGGPTPESEVWTGQRVHDDMGCLPRDLPSIMALTGDAGDGVPGIPGFGVKTAVKYLAKYEWSYGALLASGDAKVAPHVADIIRNRALVDLTQPIPGIQVGQAPQFVPTEPSSVLYPDLVSWLDSLHMDSIKNRLATRTLWR